MDETSYNGKIEVPDGRTTSPSAGSPGGELIKMRAEMSQTRAAMTQKVEAMEDKVLRTVQSAKGMVEDTVSNVKEKVEDTVHTVQRTFDIKYQTEQRPWLMVGASVAVGYAVGTMLCRRRHGEEHTERDRLEYRSEPDTHLETAMKAEAEAAIPRRNGPVRRLVRKVLDRFGDEIETLEGAAVSALMGIARDWLKNELPKLAPQVQRAFDSATSKLGGEPIEGPILQSTSEEQEEEIVPRRPR